MHRALFSALLCLANPAFAELGPADVECLTTAEVNASARSFDPEVAITGYRGRDARAFLVAMLELSPREPAFDPARVVSLGTYVVTDPHEQVLVYLFDADGCSVSIIGGSREVLAATLAKMGQGG